MRKILFLMATLILFNNKISAETFSGPAGKNVAYTIDTEKGTLIFTGSGEIEGIDGTDIPSWPDVKKAIKTLHIEEGITGVGDLGCSGFINMTKAFVSSTVKYLGDRAFGNSRAMIEITLSEGIEDIKLCCFANCAVLEHIVLPSTVKVVGNDAFMSCSALKSITCLSPEPPQIDELQPPVFTSFNIVIAEVLIVNDVEIYENSDWAQHFNRIEKYTGAGIKKIRENKTDTYYNLNGIKVDKPQKGRIYISGGRKIVVR